MYLSSGSATSIKSRSTKSSRIRLSPGLRIPASWRRAMRTRLPSKHNVRDAKSTLSQDSQKSTPPTWTRDAVSEISHKYHAAQGSDTTRPRSADHLPTVNAMFKPLPRPPDSMLRPNRQSSYFNLSPNISTLGKTVDANFLSSLEQQVLQSIQLLSEPPMTEANVLVQLGIDAFWMSSRDAGMLERINNLTEHLSPSAKAALMKDLYLLLKAPYKYPLQQVMRHGVQIIQIEPQTVHGGDNESLIDMYSYVDRYTQHLLPAPLHIRKESHGATEDPLELNHPASVGQLAIDAGNGANKASISHSRSGVDDHVESSQANADEHAYSSACTAKEKQSESHAPSDASKPRIPSREIGQTNIEPKQSGSVARARAGLLDPERGLSKQTRSSRNVENPEDSEKAWTEELAEEIAELKQPGSVRNARKKTFENPREAPKPPISIARPNRLQQTRPREVPSIPGDVGRARIAAENAQVQKTAAQTEADESANIKQNESADVPRQLGSVARARIAAEQRLRGDLAKPSHEPADAQLITLAQMSSLPALKQSTVDARGGDDLCADQSGLRELPERVSSLPLRSIEERKQNFKKGLSPISGHFKAASTNAIAGLHKCKATAVSKADSTEYRNKHIYSIDVNDDAHRILNISSPDLLTGSPLFAPASATLCEEDQVNSSTRSSPDATTAIKPIFDIHQAVTTYDQFRLRGGASSGGSSDDATSSANSVKRRISTLLGKVTPLQDHERPPKALWWLAGGRTGGVRKVPTAGELRERRKVEEANREVVGYIGTVFGGRAVRRLPMRDVDEEDEAGEEKVSGRKDAGKSATVEDELEDGKKVGDK